jgi:hypothetical protein
MKTFKQHIKKDDKGYPISYERNIRLMALVNKFDDPLKFLLAVMTQMSAGKIKLARIGVANTREVAALWNAHNSKKISPAIIESIIISEGRCLAFMKDFFKDKNRPRTDVSGWKGIIKRVAQGLHLVAIDPKTGEEFFLMSGHKRARGEMETLAGQLCLQLAEENLEESRSIFVKGWTKKNKIISATGEFNIYHIKQVVLFPRKFGLTEKKLLKILEDWFDDMSAPDPEQEAKDQLSELEGGGKIDNSPPIEEYLFKKGYCRFVIDKTHGSVEGQTEKECREGAKVLDDEYLPFERDGFKLFEIKPVNPFKPKYITSKFDWYDWLEGKKKRKHVSKMAQFRESVEYVIWGIPPKDNDETLLLTTGTDGKRITKKSDAMKLLKLLTTKHGVKKARIQELDVEVDPSDMFRNPFG